MSFAGCGRPSRSWRFTGGRGRVEPRQHWQRIDQALIDQARSILVETGRIGEQYEAASTSNRTVRRHFWAAQVLDARRRCQPLPRTERGRGRARYIEIELKGASRLTCFLQSRRKTPCSVRRRYGTVQSREHRGRRGR